MSAQLDLSIRSTGIGSSEIGAIVGVSPFSTPLDVYISKVYGPKQRKSTPNERWGLLHEHAMAIAYTEDTGIELEGDGRTTVRHPEHEVILDTVDRLAVGHSIVVDFKTAQRFTPLEYGETNWDYRIWEASLDAPTDETHLIPQCIQAQGAIHMAVHDRDRFDLPLLIDGFYWRIFTMARDAELEGYLIEAAERFWRDHVIPRKPPAAENEEERAELLKHLYPTEGPQSKAAGLLGALNCLSLHETWTDKDRRFIANSIDLARRFLLKEIDLNQLTELSIAYADALDSAGARLN
jgi:predicted phage-related endonuclease